MIFVILSLFKYSLYLILNEINIRKTQMRARVALDCNKLK